MTTPNQSPAPVAQALTLSPEAVHAAFAKHFPKTRISQAWIGFAADIADAVAASAQPAQCVPDGFSLIRTDVRDFLLGASALMGKHFGEDLGGAKYWWRKFLTPDNTPAPAPAVPQGEQATIAGLDTANGHLSTLLDDCALMLKQLRQMVGDLHEHWSNGGKPERGEFDLLDRVDDWLACRPETMLAAAPSQEPAQEPVTGNWIAADDVDRLARELDVAMNGEEGAAKHPSLCDVVAQARALLSAPSQEPVSAFAKALDIRASQGWSLKGNAIPVLYTDTINGDQVMRDDVWLCTTDALKPSQEPVTLTPIEILECFQETIGDDANDYMVRVGNRIIAALREKEVGK